MKIMGIDVGATTGWYCNGESGYFKSKTLLEYYNSIEALLIAHKPDQVVSAKPTRMYNVIASQSKKLGIVELLCETRGVGFYGDLIDSSCKKDIIGSGKATKEDIVEWAGFDITDVKTKEHEADAKMFVEFYKKNLMK